MEELLRLTRENNDMLKLIVSYINYVNATAHNDDQKDFTMNLFANMISSKLIDRQFV